MVCVSLLIKGRACPFVIQTTLTQKMTFHQRLQGNLLPDHCQDLMIWSFKPVKHMLSFQSFET